MKRKNPYHDVSMFKGAKPQTFAKAKNLRLKMTISETKLWEELKSKKLNNYKFRRQHPIHYFIADFYCHEFKLIIELDGEYHNTKEQKEYDKQRDELLNFQEIEILRITNEDVLNNIIAVKDQILIKINNIKLNCI